MSVSDHRQTRRQGDETLSIERDPGPDTDITTAEAPPTSSDRRRPERTESRDPDLITLLRSESHALPTPDKVDRQGHEGRGDSDDLDGARGLAVAVVLGVILWFAIIWLLVRLWWPGTP